MDYHDSLIDDQVKKDNEEYAIDDSYEALRAAPEANPHADTQRPTVWEPAQPISPERLDQLIECYQSLVADPYSGIVHKDRLESDKQHLAAFLELKASRMAR
jgi:hypothetical protein